MSLPGAASAPPVAISAAGGLVGDGDYPRPTIAWWSVVVFFLLYNVSYLDRQMLNLLVVPIRATLGISDFQLSLLQGFGFAVFYTAVGVPIGWLVDHRPRRRIICLGLVLWSFAASACGLAMHYWQLALGRVGVSVGEATLAPATYSLLSDIFPPGKLALPMSIMGTGASLGGALSAVIAGFVVDAVPPGGMELPVLGNLVGWQIALLLTGVPGLLFAPLIFTVPEPRRRGLTPVANTDTPDRPGRGEAGRYIWQRRRFYLAHFFGFGFYSMCNYGVTAWMPTFLMRHHHWSLKQAALTTGTVTLLAGVTGGALMGFVVDRWYSSGRRDAHLVFFAGCAILQALCVAGAVLSPDPRMAIPFLVPQVAVASFTGVAGAALQIVTPGRMRGQVSAVYLLVFNLIGLGCGPSVVALFTDFVFHDDSKVGWSLLLTFAIFAPIAAGLMLMAARAIRAGVVSAPPVQS
ncbi:MAG: MFS transporter [Novosphingobium sp.]